jgi:Fe(3+) dicitrate transport protein
MIGYNFREFLVLGGQVSLRYGFKMGEFTSELRGGLRYHMDQIERDHTEEGYLMEAQTLVPDGGDTESVVRNRGRTNAIAGFVHYGLFGYGLTLTPGLRFEHVSTGLLNRWTGVLQENVSTTLMPGVGLHYEIVEGLGVFTGVYRGFSPVAPGQTEDVMPETSTNYEAGVRYTDKEEATRIEAIGFFNDYSNLVGQCSFSSGCAPDDLAKQFNGGEVDIYGFEFVAGHRLDLGAGFQLELRGAYTFTQTEFQTAFKSANPQFGVVDVGDELPYVPKHQASLQVGFGQRQWTVDVNTVYSDAMREVAGQGDAADGEETDSFVMLDLKVRYQPLRWLEIYLKGENLTMAQPIASRRPFGARPIKPLLISSGATVQW